MPAINLWDLVAALLIAFGLIFGIAYGFKRNDRFVRAGCMIAAACIIAWRGMVWHDSDHAARHAGATDTKALYAKFGLNP